MAQLLVEQHPESSLVVEHPFVELLPYLWRIVESEPLRKIIPAVSRISMSFCHCLSERYREGIRATALDCHLFWL